MSIQFNPGSSVYWLENLDSIRTRNSDVQKASGAGAAMAISEQGVSTLRELGRKQCVAVASTALPEPKSFSASRLDEMIQKSSGFDLSSVMTVLFASIKHLRQAHREARHGERDAAVAMSMNAANSHREAASKAFAGALTAAIFQMVGAGLQVVVGGLVTGKSSFAAHGQAILAMGQAGSALLDSSGKITNATFESRAAEFRAREQEFQAFAQKAASGENEAADFQKQANDLIQSIISTMKEYLQAQNQAESSVIRNM